MTSAEAASAWAAFADALAGASSLLEVDLDLDDLDRAEGLRFLSRLARVALTAADPADDPFHPRFTEIANPVTYGMPNPDNHYQRCSVHPSLEYRITGQRNTIEFLGFAAGGPGQQAPPGARSHLQHTDMEIAEDGTFEIAVGGRRRPGNWIELTDDATSIMVRQTYLRRGSELPADLQIECLGDAPAPRPLTVDSATRRLRGAAAMFTGLVSFWPDWVRGFTDHAAMNSFFSFDEATHLAIGGDPRVRTPLARWRLADDEALVVTLRPPECDYWNIQVANIWSETIDPISGPASLNASQVAAEADGSVRVVVSASDPGEGNWLDTAGHRQGLLTVRWVNATSLPMPETEVVRFRRPGSGTA